jgi:hypothetical protein
MNMKPEDVAVTPAHTNSLGGREHSLWIGGSGESVLTITLNKRSKAFPPHAEHCAYLNEMIQGLARAAKSVIYQAEKDPQIDADFVMRPIEDIVDTIVMLTQLSEAVRSEVQS